ncbi:preprotein translocase subunit SecE [Streptococcus parauberis]|uniref:preprotein translocase subunit SecE n=1 Tax=Streptococcus parauberis TaxID=1348 RepID=UPI003F73817D
MKKHVRGEPDGIFGGIFKVLKDTTWPNKKQRWKDFISVLEYTAFFTVIIFIFDQLLSKGILSIINYF